MPQRFNDLGLAGRKPGNGVQGGTLQREALTVSDPFLQQFVMAIPIVASVAEQVSDIDLPDNAVMIAAFLRVITAEVTGGTATIDIGIDGVGAAVLGAGVLTDAVGAIPVTVAASLPIPVTPTVDVSGGTLTYTLGSDDWVEFEGELVLMVLAAADNTD